MRGIPPYRIIYLCIQGIQTNSTNKCSNSWHSTLHIVEIESCFNKLVAFRLKKITSTNTGHTSILTKQVLKFVAYHILQCRTLQMLQLMSGFPPYTIIHLKNTGHTYIISKQVFKCVAFRVAP
jgi:hypothetical protein